MERRRGSIPLSGVTGETRRNDVPSRVWSAARQRDDMIQRQHGGLRSAVGTPESVGHLDGFPLLSSEVVDGCPSQSRQTALLRQGALNRMGSVVLSGPCSLLGEPLRILGSTLMSLLVSYADGSGVALSVVGASNSDLDTVSLGLRALLLQQARLAVRSEAVGHPLVGEEVGNRLSLSALGASLHNALFASGLDKGWVVSGVDLLRTSAVALLTPLLETVLLPTTHEKFGQRFGLSALAASLHVVIIPQIVVG